MKTLYLQIAIAVTSLGAVGGGLLYMQASGEAARLEEKVKQLEAAKDRAPAKPAAAPPSKGRDYEKEISELAARVRELEQTRRALEAEAKRLRDENAALKTTLEQAKAAAAGAPAPAPASLAAQPPPPPMVVPEGAPPRPEPWGAAQDSELDELATVCKLNPEQREQVRIIITEGQNEFDQRLVELSRERGQARGIEDIERIGEEVSKKVKERILQVLYPEQQQRFREFMRPREVQSEPR